MGWQGLTESAKSATELAALQRHARWLEAMQGVVRAALPPTLASLVFVGNWHEDETLTLLSPSALAVARLKQMTPTLTAALQAKGYPVARIKLRVAPGLSHLSPPEPFAAPPKAPPRALTPQARSALAALAQELPPNNEVGTALREWLAKLRAREDR